MDIVLYKFSKRKNSTKVPSGGTTISNVFLKEETSITTPTFRINFNIDIVNYNYAYAFGRYYFIDDKTSMIKEHWEISCSIDLLATYRSSIMATSAYVLYSTSNYNVHIPDPRLDVSNSTNQSNVYYPMSDILDPNDGTYLIHAVGNADGSAGGFATVYAHTKAQIARVAQQMTTIDWGNIWEEVMQAFTSAYDAIVGCFWMPVHLLQYASRSTITTVMLGDYDTNIPMYRLNTPLINGAVTIPISWNYSDFRNGEPYTTIAIHLPVVGVVDMSASDLYGKERIQISYSIDLISGDIAYKIAALPGDILLQTLSANMRVNLPIGQNTGDITGMLGGVGTAVAGVIATVSTGGMGGIVAAAGGVANAALASNRRGVSTSGGFGGRAGSSLESQIRLVMYSKETSQTPGSMASVLGRPCGRTVSLSTLSGYVQTMDASVDAVAPGDELDSVNSLLNGGIYIE